MGSADPNDGKKPSPLSWNIPMFEPANTGARVALPVLLIVLGIGLLVVALDAAPVTARESLAASDDLDRVEATIVGHDRVAIAFVSDVVELPDEQVARMPPAATIHGEGSTMEVRVATSNHADVRAGAPIRYVGQEPPAMAPLLLVLLGCLGIGGTLIVYGTWRLVPTE